METAIAIGKHLLGSLAIGYIIVQFTVLMAIGSSLAAGRIDKISFGMQTPIIGVAVAIAMWAFG